jgi:2-oxo-3-hexenedioate decarboxylase
MTAASSMAEALIAAERDRQPIVPFTRGQPFLTADMAYQAQAQFVAHRVAAGERVIGVKLGMTTKVKRVALGIHEPIYGRLTSGMILDPGEPVPLDKLIHPRAEPEIALLLGRDVTASTTPAEVLAAVAMVLPAIEVVDSRYRERFRLPDSVADNAGAARIMLGAQGRPPGNLVGLHVIGCLFRWRSGAHTAAGGAAMGHPATALAWLANTLVSRGETLDAGTIVLTGGLTPSIPLLPGEIATTEFDGLGAVEVHCR